MSRIINICYADIFIRTVKFLSRCIKPILKRISNISQLTLFPIACKSQEANPGDFFALRGEHVLQKIFLERFLLVKMTLMKGAEVI